MMTRREVMVSIHTRRRGLPVPLFRMDGEPDTDEEPDEACEAVGDSDWEEAGADGEPEEADLLMEGRLVTTTLRVEVVYEESVLTGMEGSVTKIGFDRNQPGLVSLLRSGSVSTALIFEPGRRHVCIYNTPFSCFEVCVQTLDVQNRLLESGELYLDYLIEIHGARTEHCQMTLKLH